MQARLATTFPEGEASFGKHPQAGRFTRTSRGSRGTRAPAGAQLVPEPASCLGKGPGIRVRSVVLPPSPALPPLSLSPLPLPRPLLPCSKTLQLQVERTGKAPLENCLSESKELMF